MNPSIRLLACSALVSCATLAPSLGQGEAAVPILYRITSFGTGHLESRTYSNTPGGDSFQVNRMHVSNPIKAKLREGRFLDFYADGKPPAEGEEGPAFSVQVTGRNHNDLLVILMVQQGEVKPLMVDLKAIKLQGGGQYVYNLLNVPVAFRCGEKAKVITIKPGSKANIPAPSEDKVIQTIYQAGPDGKPVEFSSSLYFRDEDTRQIVFCYGEPGQKRPKVAPICIYNSKVRAADR